MICAWMDKKVGPLVRCASDRHSDKFETCLKGALNRIKSSGSIFLSHPYIGQELSQPISILGGTLVAYCLLLCVCVD